MACTEHLVANLVEGCSAVWQRRGSFQDHAREFGASDPRKRWLVLVLAADLQQVEEVGCRGVDGDQVLIVFWYRVRKRLDLEVFWSLAMSIGETCDGRRRNTLTYSLIWMPFMLLSEWLQIGDKVWAAGVNLASNSIEEDRKPRCGGCASYRSSEETKPSARCLG